MTPKQIARHAARTASLLVIEQPAKTFLSLHIRADELFGTGEGKILDAVIAILDRNSDAAHSHYNEFSSLNRENIDCNVACENIDRAVVEGTIGFWPLFFSSIVNATVCTVGAENVQWTPAARCVY